MRLWHWLVFVWMAATALAVARTPVGRVALVVFTTGLIEVVLATTAIMTLFRTVGAIGEARRITAYAEAILATVLVLTAASVVMNTVLSVSVRLVRIVVP